MSEATVTSKGQITIPKAVREALDLMGALGEATHLAHVETCDRMGYATWLRR